MTIQFDTWWIQWFSEKLLLNLAGYRIYWISRTPSSLNHSNLFRLKFMLFMNITFSKTCELNTGHVILTVGRSCKVGCTFPMIISDCHIRNSYEMTTAKARPTLFRKRVIMFIRVYKILKWQTGVGFVTYPNVLTQTQPKSEISKILYFYEKAFKSINASDEWTDVIIKLLKDQRVRKFKRNSRPATPESLKI